MNLHINGIEIKTVSLDIEAVARKGFKTPKGFFVPTERTHYFRAKVQLERNTRMRIFYRKSAVLTLERAPTDPSLLDAFSHGLEVLVGRRKYRVYYRSRLRNQIRMREIPKA